MARTITVHASGAETATTQSATMTLNSSEVGGNLHLNISASSGTTPTLDIKLQAVDELSNTFVDIPGASFAQKTGTGTDTLVVFPGVTAAANRAVSYTLPRTFRAVYTLGGTTPSFTFTLTCHTAG